MSTIFVQDGPAGGRTFPYPDPPKVVVIAEEWDGKRLSPKYHDYLQVGTSRQYQHSPNCFQCREARPAMTG